MAEPAAVVEEIQRDAAEVVADQTVAGDVVIAAEVAAVGDELADHAEVSEERHEEILGGEQWLGLKVDQIQTSFSAGMDRLVTSMESIRSQLQSQSDLMSNLILQSSMQNQKPLPDSTPLTPETPVETTIVVVEPESAAEADQKEPKTEPRRRKRRLI